MPLLARNPGQFLILPDTGALGFKLTPSLDANAPSGAAITLPIHPVASLTLLVWASFSAGETVRLPQAPQERCYPIQLHLGTDRQPELGFASPYEREPVYSATSGRTCLALRLAFGNVYVGAPVSLRLDNSRQTHIIFPKALESQNIKPNRRGTETAIKESYLRAQRQMLSLRAMHYLAARHTQGTPQGKVRHRVQRAVDRLLASDDIDALQSSLARTPNPAYRAAVRAMVADWRAEQALLGSSAPIPASRLFAALTPAREHARP